jgi:hypothetical protein
MPLTLVFDSAAAIARVLDSGLLLPSESLLPLQNEHQRVPAQPAATTCRVVPGGDRVYTLRRLPI